MEIKLYEAKVLPFVLYSCETCSLTLSEELSLRVLEDRILSRIFGLKMDDNVKWTKLHYGEFHRLFRSLNMITVIMKIKFYGAKVLPFVLYTVVVKLALLH